MYPKLVFVQQNRLKRFLERTLHFFWTQLAYIEADLLRSPSEIFHPSVVEIFENIWAWKYLDVFIVYRHNPISVANFATMLSLFDSIGHCVLIQKNMFVFQMPTNETPNETCIACWSFWNACKKLEKRLDEASHSLAVDKHAGRNESQRSLPLSTESSASKRRCNEDDFIPQSPINSYANRAIVSRKFKKWKNVLSNEISRWTRVNIIKYSKFQSNAC